jgi:hypothetical protein
VKNERLLDGVDVTEFPGFWVFMCARS